MSEPLTKMRLRTRSRIALLGVWYLAMAHGFAARRLLEAIFARAKRQYQWAIRILRNLFSLSQEGDSSENSRVRRLLVIYRRVLERGTILLFDHLEHNPPDPAVLSHYLAKSAEGNASAQLISSTAGLAVSMGDSEKARILFSDLMRRFPDAASVHQQIGVRAFILGKYDIAEDFWTQSGQLREQRIKDLGLDQYQVRYLGVSWFLAIGHIAHLDTYFKHRILNGRQYEKAIIALPTGFPVPNKELLARFSGLIEPIDERIERRFSPTEISLLQDEFWTLPFKDGRWRMFSHAGALVQRAWESEGRPPLLSLSASDTERGQAALRQLGIPEGAWFVCLHVREPGFHHKWHKSHPGTRNADIQTYLAAARAIVARGGYVIRVGDKSMTPLAREEGIVDYAQSELKSEFLDIFLCAACKFFIGTNSGLGLVPPIYGVPCAMTNWSPIGLPQWYPKDMYIPKLLYSERLNRNLTFEEMLFSEAGWGQFEKHLAKSGLRAVDNTEEELTELVLEMLERENGNEAITEEDRQLKGNFDDLVVRSGSYVGAQIGAGFLKRHHELLAVSAVGKKAVGIRHIDRYGT